MCSKNHPWRAIYNNDYLVEIIREYESWSLGFCAISVHIDHFLVYIPSSSLPWLHLNPHDAGQVSGNGLGGVHLVLFQIFILLVSYYFRSWKGIVLLNVGKSIITILSPLYLFFLCIKEISIFNYNIVKKNVINVFVVITKAAIKKWIFLFLGIGLKYHYNTGSMSIGINTCANGFLR